MHLRPDLDAQLDALGVTITISIAQERVHARAGGVPNAFGEVGHGARAYVKAVTSPTCSIAACRAPWTCGATPSRSRPRRCAARWPTRPSATTATARTRPSVEIRGGLRRARRQARRGLRPLRRDGEPDRAARPLPSRRRGRVGRHAARRRLRAGRGGPQRRHPLPRDRRRRRAPLAERDPCRDRRRSDTTSRRSPHSSSRTRHMASGGTPLGTAAVAELADAAAGRPVHLDGARLWNATVALGVDAASLAAPVTTVIAASRRGCARRSAQCSQGPPT